MQLFEPMCKRSDCRGEERSVFMISRKTTDKQIVVYHSELAVPGCSSGTIATCPVVPKKQELICLEVLRFGSA